MLTYENCADIIEKQERRGYNSKRLAKNLYLYKDGYGSFVIKYYDTVIVIITPNGYILNSGGYRTYSTKKWINKFTPAYVFQHKFVWYIGEDEFYDGIVLDKDGMVFK